HHRKELVRRLLYPKAGCPSVGRDDRWFLGVRYPIDSLVSGGLEPHSGGRLAWASTTPFGRRGVASSRAHREASPFAATFSRRCAHGSPTRKTATLCPALSPQGRGHRLRRDRTLRRRA